MRILLLGATGRTGKLVLKKAIKSGYHVNCLARNSNRIEKHKLITVFEGQTNNAGNIQAAIVGCNAIISVLNISRTSDFPWAKLITPETFLSETMQTIVPIAEKSKVNRIVLCSAWGVSETKTDIPKWFKWLIDNSNIGVAYKDHERQEKILSNSMLDWTIVRPVGLTNSKNQQ